MFLASDRVARSTHVGFHERSTMAIGAAFLQGALAAFPYRLRAVLTVDGIALADAPRHRGRWTARYRGHAFDRVCREHGIEHRLTRPQHPWTNGQAEWMNRTVKDATIKAFHYPDLAALRAHVLAFVSAHDLAKHLKALRWRTPFQAICDTWTKDPALFTINPHHVIPGPNTDRRRFLRHGGRGAQEGRGEPEGTKNGHDR